MPNNQLYKNKYRIPSARREAYNYSQNGFYFITICTQNRELFFGNIIDNKMILSEIGKIAEQEWINTDKIRNNVILHEFVIMPNHIHGIIQIKNPVETHGNASNVQQRNAIINNAPTAQNTPIVETHGNASAAQQRNTVIETHIETHIHASLRQGGTVIGPYYKNKFGPQSKNVSSIIRGFKGAVKKYATINNINFTWQPRFHDHIIKNDKELNKIRFYIQINIEKWNLDRNNPKNNIICY